jgi:transposase
MLTEKHNVHLLRKGDKKMEKTKKETEQLDPEQSVKCPNCGTVWQKSYTCENCGHVSDMDYCAMCGTKL